MILGDERKPVERVVETAFAGVKRLIDADTVMGKPMELDDGTCVIPVSRVTMGMLTGGGEYDGQPRSEYPFAGGSGMGASIVPIGFLVRKNGSFKVVRMSESTLLEKALSVLPDITEAIADAAACKK